MKSLVYLKTNPFIFFYLQYHWCFCYKTKASTDTGRVFFRQNLQIHQLVSVLPGWLVFTSTRGNNCIARYWYIPFCGVATSCPVYSNGYCCTQCGTCPTHNFLSQTNFKKNINNVVFFLNRRSNIFSKTFSRNKMSNFFLISYHLRCKNKIHGIGFCFS